MSRDYNDSYPAREDARFGMSWLLFGAAAVVVLTILGFALGWITLPFQVASVENVREQWRFAYDYSESLKASALQVCAAEKTLAESTSDNEKAQRRSQLLAIQQNYSRIEA